MKGVKLFIAGALINLLWFITTHAASTNDVTITEPIGGDVLIGKPLFRSNIEGGIKDSYIFSQLIPFLIKFGIKLAVSLSIIMLIIAGYQFIIAFGDAEKRKEAQKTILYALIGLVISLTALGIVTIISQINFV